MAAPGRIDARRDILASSMNSSRPSPPSHGLTVKERLREELLSYLVVSLYLFLCFGALQLFKAAVLRDAGIHYLPFGWAAVKALIVGKFMLIGEAAGVGTRVAARSPLQRIAVRAVFLFALLIVLLLVEELIMARVHGKTFAQVLAEYDERLPEVLALAFFLLLVLVPLVAVQEMDRALGRGSLWRVLRGRS
jgi:hypothetical protein